MMRKQGFTLIELMVVIVIMGIIFTMAVPSYKNYTIKAKIAKVVNLLIPYKQAIETYYELHNQAPADLNALNLKASDVIPLSDVINDISVTPVTNPDGVNLNVSLKVSSLGLNEVNRVNLIVLTYNLENNATQNILSWSCTFSAGHNEYQAYLPAGCD